MWTAEKLTNHLQLFTPTLSQIIFPAVNILIVGFSCQENVYLFRWMNMYVYTQIVDILNLQQRAFPSFYIQNKPFPLHIFKKIFIYSVLQNR